MISPKLALLATSLVLAGSAYSQTVTITLQADRLKDQNATAMLTTGVWALLADTGGGGTGNGFSLIERIGSPLAVGSVTNALSGGDDKIVALGNLVASFNNYGSNGVLDETFVLTLGSPVGFASGNPLALVWFPNLTLGSTSVEAGERYGFYTSAVSIPAPTGSAAWVTPSAGSAVILNFYTTDGGDLSPGAGATNAPAAGNASLSVVPEPSSILLSAVGLMALASRRRRNRN